MNASLPCLMALLWVGAAHATLFTFDDLVFPLAIPDGDLTGVSDTRHLSTSLPEISSLRVTLDLSGAGEESFNGDLYVTLTHGSGYAVLLNRAGRRPSSAFGYSDDGFSQVTFDEAASGRDVHAYRLVLTGSHTTPLGGPLTGVWQSDGRAVDPEAVQGAEPRTARLDSFQGLDPDGEWTLFLADVSSGGSAQLNRWSIEIITPLPDAGPGLLVFALVWLATLVARRK